MKCRSQPENKKENEQWLCKECCTVQKETELCTKKSFSVKRANRGKTYSKCIQEEIIR